MSRRRGFTVVEIVVKLVIFIALTVLILYSIFIFEQAEDLRRMQKNQFEACLQAYEKTIVDVTERLLEDASTPLTERERGIFTERIYPKKTAKGKPNFLSCEAALAQFATKKWPEAERAHTLCLEMRLLMGLMQNAKEPYLKDSKEAFTKKLKEIEAVIK